MGTAGNEWAIALDPLQLEWDVDKTLTTLFASRHSSNEKARSG